MRHTRLALPVLPVLVNAQRKCTHVRRQVAAQCARVQERQERRRQVWRWLRREGAQEKTKRPLGHSAAARLLSGGGRRRR